MHFKIFTKSLVIILFLSFSLQAFDRSFFYRASSFWDEPRFEISSLSTLNIQLTGGSTRHSKNGCSETTALFGIYGPEKAVRSIGRFIFTGAFDIFEANFNYYQNLAKGFFIHFHLPVVVAETFPISCNKFKHVGCSNYCLNVSCSCPSIDQPKLLQLNETLKSHNILLNAVKVHGLSDITLFLGWSINYENTVYLDFIDLAIQTGVLFPSGKKLNPHLLFDIPLGYNGHWGIPWVIDFSIGAYEWFTWGLHNDGVFFFNRRECIPLTKCSTGLLRFETANAFIKSEPVWRVGTYAKADHICWGLSILMAFTFEQKNRSKILRFEGNNKEIHDINNREWLKTWNRFIYQFVLEYDFSQEKNGLNNRVSFLYNQQILGKRVFSTSILGGYFGFDILWCF